MNIKHRPQFDTQKVIDHYTQKDGVEVTYVCSTEMVADDVVVDVFYRATPHPEFGNRYFGLYRSPMTGDLMITNADKIEEMTIEAIKPQGFNDWHYSQCRHDYHSVGNVAIDGGRAYTKLVGDFNGLERLVFEVRDGQLLEKNLDNEDKNESSTDEDNIPENGL